MTWVPYTEAEQAVARALFLSRSNQADDPLWTSQPATYNEIARSVLAALAASGWTLAQPAPDLLTEGDRRECPACHHPDHDPGSCREGCGASCELHFDDAIEWLRRYDRLPPTYWDGWNDATVMNVPDLRAAAQPAPDPLREAALAVVRESKRDNRSFDDAINRLEDALAAPARPVDAEKEA